MSSRTFVSLQRKSVAASEASDFTLMPSRATSGLLQRSCDCGSKSGTSGDCAECERKKLKRRVAGHDAAQRHAPPVVGEVLNGPGRPLDDPTRDFMEPRFGHDFSKVRIHTDERAAESARSVGALAYTVGRDVVFGAGRYQPGTAEGRRLLAHELTHVVQGGQQGESRPMASSLEVSRPSDPLELEAEETAARVASGAEVRAGLRPGSQPAAGVAARQVSGGPKLYRVPAPDEEEEPASATPPAETTDVGVGDTGDLGDPEQPEEMATCEEDAVSLPKKFTFSFEDSFHIPAGQNSTFCLKKMNLKAVFSKTAWDGPADSSDKYTVTLYKQKKGGKEAEMKAYTNTVGGNETRKFEKFGGGAYAFWLERKRKNNSKVKGEVEVSGF